MGLCKNILTLRIAFQKVKLSNCLSNYSKVGIMTKYDAKVEKLQRFLYDQGYHSLGGNKAEGDKKHFDGFWGPKTDHALQDYNRRNRDFKTDKDYRVGAEANGVDRVRQAVESGVVLKKAENWEEKLQALSVQSDPARPTRAINPGKALEPD